MRHLLACLAVAACGQPHAALPRPDAALACPAGSSAQSHASPRGLEAWCADDRGTREGPFERRLPGGQIAERGRYVAGLLDGDYAAFYADGARHAEGKFVHGRREGAWHAWHPNGRVWLAVTYRAGEPEGAWLEYDAAGARMFEGTYRNGRLEGAWRSYRVDGQLRASGTSAGGRLEGTTTFHTLEDEQIERPYHDNRVHGAVTTRDKDGHVTRTDVYRDGVLEGSHAP